MKLKRLETAVRKRGVDNDYDDDDDKIPESDEGIPASSWTGFDKRHPGTRRKSTLAPRPIVAARLTSFPNIYMRGRSMITIATSNKMVACESDHKPQWMTVV